jgi:hypothetical protein
MSTSRRASDKQHRWLSLVEQTGIVLSEPVLADTSPAGFRRLEKKELALFYKAREVWNLPKGMVAGDPDAQWTSFILEQLLRLKPSYWQMGATVAERFVASLTQQHETLRPSRVLMDGPEGVLIFVQVPRSQGLDSTWATGGGWKASPTTKLERVLRETEVEVGLLTNGEDWRLLIASPSETASWLTWTAQTWGDSPITLAAFAELLGEARFFAGPKAGTILQLVRQSRIRQADVADRLGQQVREALDIFVRDLDRIDRERGGDLLRSYDLDVIYETSVVLMMRLLFLLKAEESELLPHGNIYYARSYGVLHLLTHLETSHRHDPEKLGRSHEAFAQLLGTFRLVHEGSVDPDINVAPYGGLLFDPASYPLLEGRDKNGAWGGARNARGLPIRDSVVHQILRSLKYARGDAGVVQLVSYQTLAVEQIGHMYEGLLDRRVARASTEGALFLFSSADRNDLPEIPVSELTPLDRNELVLRLTEITGRTDSVIRSLLEPQPESVKQRDLGTTDPTLISLATPMLRLLRTRGIVRPGGLYVTIGADRRSQGAHYTPPQLTEPIVRFALEPLVYNGPAEGKAREDWTLRNSHELLSLKVCDIAMGSGAFLVQAVRYLANRLVEAWDAASAKDTAHTLTLPFAEPSTGKPNERLLPDDHMERTIWAKRYVAECCVYGVDKNHLAAEMAKLSLWIETLSKERPFTFLDHALRCGDSFLGITNYQQIEYFHLDPEQGKQLHHGLFNYTSVCRPALQVALEKRRLLESFPVNTVRDAQRKQQLLQEVHEAVANVTLISDLIIGAALATASNGRNAFEKMLQDIGQLFPLAFENHVPTKRAPSALQELRHRSAVMLGEDASEGPITNHTFHWPLEFPEVFSNADGHSGGFDAIIGNPPFMGGQRITGAFGTNYRDYLVEYLARGKRGSADICSYFFLRVGMLLRSGGMAGLLATNSIAQGDTREVGLEQLSAMGATITRAMPSAPWPGAAALEVAHIWFRLGPWIGEVILDNISVREITPFLTTPSSIGGTPFELAANAGKSFQGSIVLGLGFLLTPTQAEELIARNPKNRKVLFPFLNGDDITSRPDQTPSRWVINFFDWPLERSAAGSWVTANEKDRKAWLRSGFVPKDYSSPVAADFPDCLQIVEKEVKPERTRKDDKGEFELRYPLYLKWWIYGEKRPALYNTIRRADVVLAGVLHTKYWSVTQYDLNLVFSHALVVFALDAAGRTILESTLHDLWARKYSGTLETRLRYSPSRCFETLPFPAPMPSDLGEIGTRYAQYRRRVMEMRQEGLTTTYNRFHDCSDGSSEMKQLRTLLMEIDRAVMTAYGWTDIDLAHGFHETKQGVRFTLSEPARRSILDRLLELNHQRHAEEIETRSLSASKKAKPKKTTATPLLG